MKRSLLILLAALSGCASVERRPRAELPPDALRAVAGQPLVLSAPELADAPPGPVEARLAGEAVPAWISRIALRQRHPRGDRWRALPPEWISAEPDDPAALTFLHVEVPGHAVSGELRAAGLRRAVRLSPDAEPAAAPALAGEDALYHPSDASTNDYWRLRLSGIGAGGLADRHPAERSAAQALAAQWRLALTRLERADRWLAGRVMIALTRTSEASGVRAPAWVENTTADERLRRELLDPTLSDAAIGARARAWLDAQPSLAARVRDPASAGAMAVQMTDLSGRSSEASVSDGRREGAELLLRANRSALLPAPARRDAGDPLLIASAGLRSIRLPRPTGSLSAEPPGARLGPLLPDLSMARWLSGNAGTVEPAAAAAALLQRRAHANEWELYIECKSTQGEEPDSVRVWLGPRDAPAEVLTLTRAGGFSSDRTGSSAAMVSHAVRDDRWSASVAIPASAIEPDGTLLIGLTRERGVGETRRRWAWPVALLPWEDAPGRVSITLTDWYRLSR